MKGDLCQLLCTAHLSLPVVNHMCVTAMQAKLIPNKGLSNAVTVLMRFSNTLVGSAQWIFIARQLGLQ